jgi:hypothetical protein
VIDFYQDKKTPIAQAIADLLTIAFFFLLRPGKYTMSTSRSRKRTVQFRCQDVRSFKNGNILPHSSTLETLCLADAARLYLDNQKNDQHGATMHHTACPSNFCPVKVLAKLAPANPDLPISLVGLGSHVTSSHITLA